MKLHFVKFRKMFSATVFGYMITSTLTMIGVNKIPDLVISQLRGLKGLSIQFERFDFFKDMGVMQRDPMGELILQFMINLALIAILVFVTYFYKEDSPDKAISDTSTKKKPSRIYDIVVIAVVIITIGTFSWKYTVMNTRYELSIRLERLIEMVSPMVGYNDYLWLKHDFISIQTEKDYSDLLSIIDGITNQAKKNGVKDYGDGVIDVNSYVSPDSLQY